MKNKEYELLRGKIKALLLERWGNKDAAERIWAAGKMIREHSKKNKITPIKEYEIVKQLGKDLHTTQIPTAVRFFETYPDFESRKKKLPWALYYHLISMPKKERLLYEKKLLSGEIKTRKELRRILREKRENG